MPWQKGDFLHVFNCSAPPQSLHFATFLRPFETLAPTYARYEEIKESTNPLTFQAVFSPLMGAFFTSSEGLFRRAVAQSNTRTEK